MNKIEILQRLVKIQEFELKQRLHDAKHPERADEERKDLAYSDLDALINDMFVDINEEYEGKNHDKNRNIREFNQG